MTILIYQDKKRNGVGGWLRPMAEKWPIPGKVMPEKGMLSKQFGSF